VLYYPNFIINLYKLKGVHSMDYGKVLGLGGLGAGPVIASLPNTGGSRHIVAYVAIASTVLGVAILTSSIVRSVAKARLSA
jgi:hypothetical protein